MKKLLIAAVLAGLVLTGSGCGNVVASESDAASIQEESSEQPESTEESAEASAEESTESSEESSEASEESEPEESESSEAGEASSEPEESGEEESEEASEEFRSPSAGRDTGGRVPDSPAASESSTPDSEESSSAPDNTAGNTTVPEGNTGQTGNSQASNSQTNNSQTNNSQTNSQPAAHTHTYVTQTVSEATCEQAKVVQDVCSCGDVQNRRTEGSALGHDYQGYFVYDEPTCSYTGLSGQTCTRCGRTSINGTIPQLPHDYEAKVITEGDCNGTPHVVEYTCKNCGSYYKETDPNYHANDHNWITGEYDYYDESLHQWVKKERTYCSVCNRDKE